MPITAAQRPRTSRRCSSTPRLASTSGSRRKSPWPRTRRAFATLCIATSSCPSNGVRPRSPTRPLTSADPLVLQAYHAFAQAAAPTWNGQWLAAKLAFFDAPVHHLPLAPDQLPDLVTGTSLRGGGGSNTSATELAALRWVFGDDSLKGRHLSKSNVFAKRNRFWARYMGAVRQLLSARRETLGYMAVDSVHPSVFRIAIKKLRNTADPDPDILAALELFDTDARARRDHFAAAERGEPVGMPSMFRRHATSSAQGLGVAADGA